MKLKFKQQTCQTGTVKAVVDCCAGQLTGRRKLRELHPALFARYMQGR